MHRFADRQVKHIGHTHDARRALANRLALDGNFKNLGPVALAVAIRATQVNVAQELHLDMLEAGATAGWAAPVTAVETELRRGVAALPRQWCLGKQLAHSVPCADVAGRIGARGLANG